jgi:peptidoglycan/LPS O-acetylase OafA/YrhL
MGALRLFLATGVLLGHYQDQVSSHLGLTISMQWTLNVVAGRAVLLFYVVSGFLISYALHHKYPATRAGTMAFFRSRFLRIYPLWWVLLLVAVCIAAPQPWLATHKTYQLLPAFFIFGLDWIVGFWTFPTQYWNLLPEAAGIGWTLAPELTFYVLAPWLLRAPRIALAALVVSLAVRGFAYWYFFPVQSNLYFTWTYFFFPAVFMFFLLGHLSERLSRRCPIGLWPSLVLLAAAGAMFSRDPLLDGSLPWAACLCFAAALPGLFAATKDNRALNYLGDLTYPLYLTHLLLIAALFWPWQIIYQAGQWMTAFAAAVAPGPLQGTVLFVPILLAALGFAALVHLAIETPLRRGFSQLFDAIVGLRVRPSLSPASEQQTPLAQ